MTASPFRFLLEVPEEAGAAWLRDYVSGRPTTPAVAVPRDHEPVAYLLSEVNPLLRPELPRRVGALAGRLLRAAVEAGEHLAADSGYIRALFDLAESLPVSDQDARMILDLATVATHAGASAAGGFDLRLHAMRALVHNQRPVPGEIDDIFDFWRRRAHDLRYGTVAIQGLLALSVAKGLEALPGLLANAREAGSREAFSGTLAVVAALLGREKGSWELLASAFRDRSDDLEAVRAEYRRLGLPARNPDAWAVVSRAAGGARILAFPRRYTRADDPDIETALRGVGGGPGLRPRARD